MARGSHRSLRAPPYGLHGSEEEPQDPPSPEIRDLGARVSGTVQIQVTAKPLRPACHPWVGAQIGVVPLCPACPPCRRWKQEQIQIALWQVAAIARVAVREQGTGLSGLMGC